MKSVITDLVGASKRYGSVQALRDVSFEVARGEQALVQIARAFADNTRVLIIAVTLDQTVRSLER